MSDVATGRGVPDRLLADLLDAVDDVVYVIDDEGRSAFWNETLEKTTGYTTAEIAEMDPKRFLPPEQREHTPGLGEAIEALGDSKVVLDIVTKGGESIPHEFRGTTIEDPRTGEVYRVGVARDVAEREQRERALERQRDELATLSRINGLLLEITRDLVETGSREAVERAVCERLTESELYHFARVGERAYGGDRVVPRQRTTEGPVEAASTDGPALQACRTGEVQVGSVADVAVPAWRDSLQDGEGRRVAAVPLSHEGTVYGVLLVAAARTDAFSRREQTAFRTLGDTVGFVIGALKQRDLLFAESAVELTFRTEVSESPLREAAAALDCDLDLAGAVAVADRWLLYLDVTGASPGAVVEQLTGAERVDRVRVVADEQDGQRVEVRLTDAVLLDSARAAGGTLQTATVTADCTRFVVEVPGAADVREAVRLVRSAVPEASLLSRTEVDRTPTAPGTPGGVLGELTDRQAEALSVAYRAGYFEWPRQSTAEAVAETLEVAPPTLHAHLRKAQQQVLRALLD
ncbi:bacterio-opsin activator domain-containing protein [Halobacteriales archaeon Cl-PHB]